MLSNVSQDLYDKIVSKLKLHEYNIFKGIRSPYNYYNIIDYRYKYISQEECKNYDVNLYEALLSLESQQPELTKIFRCGTPGDIVEEIRFIVQFLYDRLKKSLGILTSIPDHVVPGDYPIYSLLDEKFLKINFILSDNIVDRIVGMIIKTLFNHRYQYIYSKCKETGIDINGNIRMIILYARLNDISYVAPRRMDQLCFTNDDTTKYGEMLRNYISYKDIDLGRNKNISILHGYICNFEDWIHYGSGKTGVTLYKKYGMFERCGTQRPDEMAPAISFEKCHSR